MHPGGGSTPVQRSGPGLSVWRKTAGRWVLFRDANMITDQK
jgi:ketosteroid isomerase-like protein